MARNATSKLKRVQDNFGIDLTNEIKIPKIGDFQTRKEFNEWKENIKSFTNRYNLEYQFVKNKHGMVLSKKEINRLEREANLVRRKAKERKKELSKLPFYSGGREQGTVDQRMRQMKKPEMYGQVAIPPKFNFDVITDERHLESRRKSIQARLDPLYYEKRMEALKDNFLSALVNVYHSEADELVKKVETMSDEDFLILNTTTDIFTVEYVYPTEVEDPDETKIDEWLSTIEDYEKGIIKPSIQSVTNKNINRQR